MSILLDLLGPVERLALPYVVSMVAKEYSANRIIRELKVMGFKGRVSHLVSLKGVMQPIHGIRRKVFLKLVRRVKGSFEAGRYVQSLRKNVLPNPDNIPEAVFKIKRNYSYKIHIRGFNLATGINEDRYLSLATNILISKNDAISAAVLEGMLAMGEYFQNIEGLDVETIVKNPLMGVV